MTEAHPPLDLFGIAWRLGATLFFVLLNGFFVAAEFALVKVREARIDQFANEGHCGARTTNHILDTARLGRLPRKGDAVRVGPYDATVIELARRRVARLRMLPAQREASAAEESA